MDVVKTAKDYFLSSQSVLLLPNRDYGARKLISVGIFRSSSAGSLKLTSQAEKAQLARQGSVDAKQSGGTETAACSQAAVDRAGQLVPTMRSGNKQWRHPPEALLNGHILYTVKFLGECMVDQPKGTEIVKDAIRKMKFNKHIKRAEGQKPPKVELVISADAVSVLEPKSRTVMHQYPLHRISYCADDKSDKRMFTFVAKEATGDKHFCYVFDSEKCAEEITLTIGQAFDLAYKRFLETSAGDVDIRKQLLLLQKRIQTLQFENDSLRKRLEAVEKLKDRSDIEEYKHNNQITDIKTVTLSLGESSTDEDLTPVSPSSPQTQTAVVGRRLENLMLHTEVSNKVPNTNGTHSPGPVAPILSPPPTKTRSNRARTQSVPSSPQSVTSTATIDPFGMEAFNPSSAASEQEFIDIQDGFSRGLTFGAVDFTLEELDPLNKKP
ncbi:PTB domain-containing engulfment adapter protein 1-like [Physella acuta]|uniref:PTB domain-containing engulfment adapter protein 1-like n=1 Tax=Physella acuta TaxID=109671 RepID=UPI0027DB36CF|nr:PTB domain-containing engulfment adapter protein 1-like [Physella acuta]